MRWRADALATGLLALGRTPRRAAAELAIQPGPRLEPIALRRAQRDTERGRRFFLAVAGEEAALDDIGQPWRDLRQTLERVVEFDQAFVAVDGEPFGVRKRHVHGAGAALFGALGERMVDQRMAHGEGGGA